MNGISSTMNGILVTMESLRAPSAADLVVYLGVTPLQPAEIVGQIKAFLDQHPRKVASICLVAPKFRQAVVEKVCACDNFVQLRARLGVESHACLFDRDGKIAAIDGDLPSRMLRRVLTEVVRSRHGVLGASGAVHYAKPSHKHTDQFIRAGNVLVNSVEVEIIAWGCLRHIPDDAGFVYTDTGAINAVAASARELLTGFGATAATFSVDSFGSYQGLKTFAGAKAGSVWLISATTSGNLAQTIIDSQGVERKQIVSLFSLGAPSETAVCRLDHDEQDNPRGFPRIKSYPPDDCALCRAGSTPLWLTDEQFLVSDIAVTSYLPKNADLSAETRGALQQLVGERVFRVSYQPNQHTERSDIFFDLEPHAGGLLTQPPGSVGALAARFLRRVQQSLPAAVDAIVHLDDPASKALALAVQAYIAPRGLTPTLTAAGDLASQASTFRPESIVVVASTVSSGISVIDLSRTLRPLTFVRSISYIVLIDRSATKERAEQTQQSVTMAEDGHRYDYHAIARLPLPDPSAAIRNAWDDETGLLQPIVCALGSPHPSGLA